jgi:hypothetical protein
VPSIRTKALSRGTFSPPCLPAPLGSQRGAWPPFRPYRWLILLSEPRACTGARAPNQRCGLACADEWHPRAALGSNNPWIPGIGAQHPVESHGQLSCRRHLGYSFRLPMAVLWNTLTSTIYGRLPCLLPSIMFRAESALAPTCPHPPLAPFVRSRSRLEPLESALPP